MAIVIVFMILLIIFQLRKREVSQQSILMKILTNYMQVLSAVMTMRIKYPDIVKKIFYPADKVGSPSTPFVSFDCFVRNQQLSLFAPSPAFFKIFLTAMLPLILLIITLITYELIWFLPFAWAKEIKRNIVVTTIVILFILHPNLTKNSLSMLDCVRISKDHTRLAIDLEIK